MYERLLDDPELHIQPPRPGEQQYNARGEPVNMSTKRHKEDMIAASNEVLAAVGVCEKRDKLIDRMMLDGEQRVRLTDQEWKIVREGEDDYGETIRMVAETSRNVLTWWVMGLRRRIQVGLVYSNLGFIDILSG